MTYQSKVYRQQGGAKLVVASGGNVTVQSGGTLDIEGVQTITSTVTVPSGGTIAVASGGKVTMDVGANFTFPVVSKTAANSATAIVANTINLLTATTTAPSCALPPPSNALKGSMIKATLVAKTSSADTYTLTTTADFLGADGKRKLKFGTLGHTAVLYGTRTAWCLGPNTATTTS
jgi:hypothetical protein